ncbi:hypothetical protein QF015_003732 [Paenarthrobacter sp. TE4293]
MTVPGPNIGNNCRLGAQKNPRHRIPVAGVSLAVRDYFALRNTP